MGKADLHIHTSHSDGMADVPELLDYVEEHTDLDIIGIVDHDDIGGALAARERWAKGSYRFALVTGIEVTALEGHVLALWVEEPVPSLVPLERVVEAVRQQGGLCVVPHPLSWLTRSIGMRTLTRFATSFDGIEVACCSPAARVSLRRADPHAFRDFIRWHRDGVPLARGASEHPARGRAQSIARSG